MGSLWQDVHFSFRMLLKHRTFTLIAVLSLAIGIGANSAMFSFADGLLLRPLPVRQPSQVVALENRTLNRTDSSNSLSYRDYVDYRDQNRSFSGLIAYTLVPFGFSQRPDALPQVKYGLLVSGNLFQVMGVQPLLGRDFRVDEDQVPGRDAVVILGYDFWQSQFHGDREVIGRMVRLNGLDFIVIGVAPEKFNGLDQYFRDAVFVPIHMSPVLAGNPKHNLLEGRDHRALTVKGRLRPGVSIAQAQAEFEALAKGLARTYPDTNRDQTIAIRTELQLRIDNDAPDAALVAMLLALSAMVLLVACANVASLLLSRARARSREMALRLAIGAGRSRLVRQLLTESLFIGLAGGVLSLAVARLGLVLIQRIQVPTDMPIQFDFQLDTRVLLFSLAASLASVLFFGLVPAWQTSRTDLVPALKSLDADSAGRKRFWGRNALVVGQVALSLVLLVVTAMMYRGFSTQLGAGPGYRTNHLLMMSFDPTLVKFSEEQTQQFYKQVADRAVTLPGVKSATLTRSTPMAPNQESIDIAPEGYQLPKGQDSVSILSDIVGPHYFETIGIAVVRGRGILATDTAASPKVAVINENLASKYWPNQDPIGRRFRLRDAKADWVQVVGVARNSKYIFISEPPLEYLYMPLAQHPQSRMTLLAESVGEPSGLLTELREMVRGIDSNQPIYDVRTMEDLYTKRAVDTPNLIMQAVGSLGLMGLLLAMVGLYGLVANSVSRRTREFGIRIAIGAARGQLLGLVLRQGFLLAITGIGIGLVLSIGAARGLKAAFITSASDPMAMVVVPPLLLVVTMLAAYVPALRASRVDPLTALRDE
ncbi:MAG TPA: ABC transporter permease [Bryobacteraceae bacterium]|nr:ABC transporter permease [Bryobacteraceae bacterium]